MDTPIRPRWDLATLRKHVRQTTEDPTVALAYISSVSNTGVIFQYHIGLAFDALKRIPIPENGSEVSAFEAIIDPSREHMQDLLVIRANVLSCIHLVRNAYDLFAQLCNALLLAQPLDESKATLYMVRKSLPRSPLKDLLDSIASSEWFRYVNDYSNTSKHRALVQQSMFLSLEDGVGGVRTVAFSHDGREYPAYELMELLEGILELKNQIVHCGNALNDLLLAQPSWRG
ncbi:TPA: hypothetical protein ACOEN9_000213 [Stenotrophomonas maltophilia]|uniref:hypothetical protein n=1 Tax=Stenotrophomonas maltophilia TaxID=40324 RepID=UPI000C269966|nr:hypothetical protein [Stenotrophomonas maltophilia]MBH1787563.1 hypothetical protein [Stenotrophomonas maltophilia]PJK95855.1 hypothetical protein B9Y63_20275 [Stenotrophomonas maltophilia]